MLFLNGFSEGRTTWKESLLSASGRERSASCANIAPPAPSTSRGRLRRGRSKPQPRNRACRPGACPLFLSSATLAYRYFVGSGNRIRFWMYILSNLSSDCSHLMGLKWDKILKQQSTGRWDSSYEMPSVTLFLSARFSSHFTFLKERSCPTRMHRSPWSRLSALRRVGGAFCLSTFFPC